jgi:3-oxoacyl-[acyl-carrier-protein] synthase II
VVPASGDEAAEEGITTGNSRPEDNGLEFPARNVTNICGPRVLITGIGIVGPTGIGKELFWNTLLEGRSVIRPLTRFDASTYPCKIAGEVPDQEYLNLIDPKRQRRMPLVSRMAVAATKLALEDARLPSRWPDPYRVGVVSGTSLGGYKEGAEQTIVLQERGIDRVNPFLTLSSYYHSTAGEMAIETGAQGMNLTETVGCPSGLCAVGVAADLIRHGRLDVCVAGGSEAPIFPIVFAGMCQAKELSTMNEEPSRASRPFDKGHNGIVLSEGSCIFILESEDHARRRNVKAYAEVAGYAVGCEAHEMYGIEPTGSNAVRTFGLALDDAGCSAAEIDYISAHGNSCPRWDRKETAIFKKALGALAYEIPASSIKGAIGHNFGAAGAFQVASVAMAFESGLLPPTANFEEPDPLCDLDYICGIPRPKNADVCLISNFGYGGVNAFMVLRRPDARD